MRFVAGFLVVLATVLGASWLSVGDPDGAQVATDEPSARPDSSTVTAADQVAGEGDEADADAVADGDADDGDEDAGDGGGAAEPTATPEPAGPTTFTMAFTGEILSHGSVIRQAGAYGDETQPYDYAPMFEQVRPLLESVDLAVCHVETPISGDNTALSGYPIFNAPTELADGIATVGYDACSTASNHSYDRGASGVITTVDMLEAAGVPQAGMNRTAEEAATPRLYPVGDVTVGHLSYTYGLNGFVLPADQPYLVNVTAVDTVLAEAAATRAAGADFIVLSIQWGNEYQVQPSQEQIDLASTFLASPDIDLIIGAHVHVVQPVENVGGEWVVYGLGNFLSNQSAECCPAASQNGIMAFVEVTGTPDDGYEVTDLSFMVTRVDRTDFTIVPVPIALTDPNLDPSVRALYEDVIASTTEVVNSRGAALELYEPRPG